MWHTSFNNLVVVNYQGIDMLFYNLYRLYRNHGHSVFSALKQALRTK